MTMFNMVHYYAINVLFKTLEYKGVYVQEDADLKKVLHFLEQYNVKQSIFKFIKK